MGRRSKSVQRRPPKTAGAVLNSTAAWRAQEGRTPGQPCPEFAERRRGRSLQASAPQLRILPQLLLPYAVQFDYHLTRLSAMNADRLRGFSPRDGRAARAAREGSRAVSMLSPLVATCRGLVIVLTLVVLPLLASFGVRRTAALVEEAKRLPRSILTQRRLAPPPLAMCEPGETLRYRVAAPTRSDAPEDAPRLHRSSPGAEAAQSLTLTSATGHESELEARGQAGAQRHRDSLASDALPREPNPFLAIQLRLRALGASYYGLETWGEAELYRFQSKVAMDRDPEYHRYFSAVDADPLRAMERVLREVEDWCAGRAK